MDKSYYAVILRAFDSEAEGFNDFTAEYIIFGTEKQSEVFDFFRKFKNNPLDCIDEELREALFLSDCPILTARIVRISPMSEWSQHITITSNGEIHPDVAKKIKELYDSGEIDDSEEIVKKVLNGEV